MDIRLETDRLVIRTLPPGFASTVLEYLEVNQHFFEPWLPAYGYSYFTEAFHREALEDYQLSMDRGTAFRFFIFHKSDVNFARILGDVSYSYVIRGVLQSCFLGYKVDKKANGLGVATEAIRATNAYIFEELSLHRIEANIIPRNKASANVVKKLGFHHEGCSKDYLRINGKWEDHDRYAIINPNPSEAQSS